MKKLLTLLSAIVLAASAPAQTANLPGNPFAPALTLNASNVAAHAALQGVTSNTFILFTNSVATAGWLTNGNLVNTNGVFINTNPGVAGFIARGANLPYQSNSRWIMRYTVPAQGLQSGEGLFFGFSTNASGVAPSDNNKLFGFGFNVSGN